MARLDEIDRDVLHELEELVNRCLAALDTQSASVEGVRQVAEILNRLPDNRAGMVELLRAHDPEVVSQIEMSMYDFFILSRQTEQVITRLLDEVPMEQWAIALKGAEPLLRDAILSAMPKRQAQSFEDLMRRSGPVPMSRIEQTRREIMATVKALADAGEIDVHCSPRRPPNEAVPALSLPPAAPVAPAACRRAPTRAPAPARPRNDRRRWPTATARASAKASRRAWSRAAPTASRSASAKACSAASKKAAPGAGSAWSSWPSRSTPC